jgi:hypothetical protein
MLDTNNPLYLWVSSSGKDGGDGTHENPFREIEEALAIVKPGNSILLTAGVYGGDKTFDISGTIHEPIRIAASPGGAVEIRAGSWFFYDVNDLIVSGLVFRAAPGGAISVIGRCSRNRFEGISFVNCGTRNGASCALFFGGSGGACNVVENCRFERMRPAGPVTPAGTVGLMVSEGDTDGEAPIIDHVFRKNYFVNYDYGVLVGTGDAPAGQYGHIVEYNTVEECGEEGILVKCSDTIVRGNSIKRCLKRSITIVAGRDSVVDSNRISDCGTGIQVNGCGHTVVNNCVVRCGGEGIGISGEAKVPERHAAANIIVENNTCVDCGTGSAGSAAARVAGVRIDAGATAVVRRNLFSGRGRPYAGPGAIAADKKKCGSLIIENIAVDRCEAMTGADAAIVAFKNATGNDFTNDSGFGASGPVLTPLAFDPHADDIDEANDYRSARAAEPDEEGEDAPEPADAGKEDFDSFMKKFYSKTAPHVLSGKSKTTGEHV